MRKIFPPVIWSVIFVFVFLLPFFALAVGIIWTGTSSQLGANKNWSTIASDSGGSHLAAAVSYGRLYISSSSGAVWAEKRPAGDFDEDWRSVASDADGSNLIAAVYNGRIYTSSDSGRNWAQSDPTGSNEKWTAVASDADGSDLIAVINFGWVYISTTSGATWAARNPAGAKKNWSAAASDDDGSTLFVSAANGRTYISTTSGAIWAERFPAGDNNKDWRALAVSADGSHLLAAVNLGRIYISPDSGRSWTETRPADDTDQGWQAVASDADGTALVAAAYGGRLYASTDSGAIWMEKRPVGDSNQDWQAVASDVDGSHLLAAVYGGQIYLGALDSTPPTLTSVSLISDNASSTLAKAGNQVTLSFSASEDIVRPTVVFRSGGSVVSSTVAIASTTAKAWTAAYSVDSPDADGAVTFTIDFADLAANDGTEVTAATDGTHVTADLTAPGAPSALPAAGTYSSAQSVVLSATGAASIRYTVDGSIPGCSSGLAYSGAISIISSSTIEAIACDAAGNYSAVSSFVYVISAAAPAPAPAVHHDSAAPFSPPPASGSGAATVNIPLGESKDIGRLQEGGVNILAYEGAQAEFTVLTGQARTAQAHSLKIVAADLADKSVVLQIRSNLQTVRLGLDQTAEIDLDDDQITDLAIKFAALYVNRIELTVKPLAARAEAGETAAPKTEELKKESAAPASSCFIFMRDLKPGQSDPDVKELQKYLNSHGFVISRSGPGSPGRETIKFGTFTWIALSRFQQANKIILPTGFFGQKTRAVMNK